MRCHSTSREVGKYWLIFCIRIKKKPTHPNFACSIWAIRDNKAKVNQGKSSKVSPYSRREHKCSKRLSGPIARRWTPPVLASPANMQGETETLWPRPKMLRLNFRSLLSWICSVAALLGWSLSLFFAEQNLQGQSVSSDDAFKTLEQFTI